ncbi:LCP family protein required for cell wall assembly [Peptoniphilus ivorii]|uniref:LCP family protein n=1 Tax=Aedoeadaptatus ivorii TaxID=54006 RepID=UPI00277FCCB5|nr:LCP family protein [Peptoniphilus ivorii]MDQ0509119.1 LCP family protein required for cell wall assembly [Peptoniphilus ivorii]
MKYIKIAVVTLAILVLAGGLALGYRIQGGFSQSGKVSKEDVAQAKEKIDAMDTTNPFNGDDPLHILLFGIDKTATTDMSAEKNPTRSDVIMLVTIDPVTKRAQLLSLPRDTYVNIEGHEGKTKLGHAYAYGGEALAEKTVEEFLDVRIDYYATVDYEAVKRLVDAVGGIEVDIPFDYTYEDTYVVPNLKIDFKKGKQKLNGDDAVRYLRIRKIYENQDIDRIQVQQKFMMQLFDKLKHPAMLLKVPELIDITLENVETNLNYGQLAYLAQFSLGMGGEDIQTDTLVGENKRIGEVEYYIVDQDTAQEQVKRFYGGKGSYFREIEAKKEKATTDTGDAVKEAREAETEE